MLLIIWLTILLIFSFSLNRSPLSASNILVFAFLVSSICAYIISNDIGYSLSSTTIFVVVLFNLIFVVFNNVFSKDFSGNSNINVKDGDEFSSPSFINVKNSKIALSFLLQIITIYLVMYFLKNEFGSLDSNTLAEFRSLTLYSNNFVSPIPGWLKFMEDISQLISFVSIYIFMNNYFSNHKNIKKNIYFLILSFASVPLYLLNSSRFGIIILFVYALLLYLFFGFKKGISKSQLIIVPLILFIILLLCFSVIGLLIGRDSGKTSGPIYYFGGSIILFDAYVRNPSLLSVFGGVQTFHTLFKVAYKLHLVGGYKDVINPFYTINGVQVGNVYSCLSNYFGDFGLYGVSIFSALLGAIYGWFYKVVDRCRLHGINMKVLLYCYCLYMIALSPYAEQVVNTVSSLGFYKNILILFLISKFYTSNV